jgi:hypothetical protein
MKRRLRAASLTGLWLALATVPAMGQESGISMPITVSGGAMYTDRLQFANPSTSAATGGFRAVLYPTVKWGSHWFGYAAVQLRESPYFYYDAFFPEHEFYTTVMQAFIGYSLHKGNTSVVFKAGELTSAFGAFPLRYDDTDNPLLDQPLSYITEIPLRANQIPCGTADLTHQSYGYVNNGCGGAYGGGAGLTPVTLYSLPGAQVDISSGRFDGRFQVTSGSPANPRDISQLGQYAQWAAGGGYTIRQGFRVGMSGFRGPYLDPNVAPLLPVGSTLRSFPASGIGIDGQWAHGRFSVNGEWQRFWFDSPNFSTAPGFTSGYGEVKTVITPHLFVAGRAGWLSPGSAEDKTGASVGQFASRLTAYELGAGYWLGRNELLKGSYEWMHIQGVSGTKTNVLGMQFVVRFNSLGLTFR